MYVRARPACTQIYMHMDAYVCWRVIMCDIVCMYVGMFWIAPIYTKNIIIYAHMTTYEKYTNYSLRIQMYKYTHAPICTQTGLDEETWDKVVELRNEFKRLSFDISTDLIERNDRDDGMNDHTANQNNSSGPVNHHTGNGASGRDRRWGAQLHQHQTQLSHPSHPLHHHLSMRDCAKYVRGMKLDVERAYTVLSSALEWRYKYNTDALPGNENATYPVCLSVWASARF